MSHTRRTQSRRHCTALPQCRNSDASAQSRTSPCAACMWIAISSPARCRGQREPRRAWSQYRPTPTLPPPPGAAGAVCRAPPTKPELPSPPQQRNSMGYLTFPGWDVLERQAQDEGRRDLVRAKLATTSPWVFADVQAIANEFSTSELIVKERTGTKLEDVENHPLELVWESPNEHMGRSFVTAFWAWSYVLASKAYLYWVPDDTGTSLMEVWPIPPSMIRPVPHNDH